MVVQNDENEKLNFVCKNCGKNVLTYNGQKRNHCNHCLCSLHTDIFPGDDAYHCHGLMKPVRVLENEQGQMKIVHRCVECGKSSACEKMIDDNYEEILKIL